MTTPDPEATVPDPAPVKVENTNPIPVEVQNDEPLRVRTEQDKVAATRVSTTERVLAGAKVDADAVRASAAVEADILTTEGQRGINRLWERTQAIIAVAVVVVTLFVVAVLIVAPVLRGEEVRDSAALVLLSSLSTGIVTSYFTRTNHTKMGGVGPAPYRRGE